MSVNPITIQSFSANDLFKDQYRKVLKWSFLAAVLLTALFVWLMPTYQPKPYVLRDSFFQLEDFQVLEDVEIPEEPLLAPPVIPKVVEAVPNETEDIYIYPDFTGFDDFLKPPPISGIEHLDRFLPLSANPVLVYFAKPNYPEIARLSKIEGMVIIKVLVGKDGLIKQTMVLQGVHPILDKAASEAARRCKFKAGTQRSIPVKAWIAIPYSFRMK